MSSPTRINQFAMCEYPTRTRSLRINFSWTLVGNIVYVGTQWGILVVLARLGDPAAVGQFSLGLAVTAPIMLFASLQLRTVQATDAHTQFQFRDYAGLRILTTIMAICVVFGISGTLYHGETALTIAAFGISKGIESLSDVVYGLWQQQERLELIARSLMLRGVLGAVAAAACFAMTHTVWISVGGMAAAWLAAFAIYDVRRGIDVARITDQPALPRFSSALMKPLAGLSLPLGVVTMLLSFNANIPRYMISQFRGVGELGTFSALGYLLIAGTIVVGALGQSATPRLALYASQGAVGEFRRLSHRLLIIGMGLGICGVLTAMLFGRQIVSLVYGREYSEHQRLFVWMLLAAAAGYMATFSGYSLTAARQFRIQLPLFSFVTVLTFALSYVMVRADGAVGAAKALSIVGFVQLLAVQSILRYTEAHMATDRSSSGECKSMTGQWWERLWSWQLPRRSN
jgi:O-antigen/teichoic acid export membrane protein